MGGGSAVRDLKSVGPVSRSIPMTPAVIWRGAGSDSEKKMRGATPASAAACCSLTSFSNRRRDFHRPIFTARFSLLTTTSARGSSHVAPALDAAALARRGLHASSALSEPCRSQYTFAMRLRMTTRANAPWPR